ncbi:MAG: FecR family protein [Prevotella sp.]|nr:FecR family protein [Prevotella sp.]
MSRYLQRIIKYFFHHDVSEDIVTRVHNRLAEAGSDTDETFRILWDECEGLSVDDISSEAAYYRTVEAIHSNKTSFRHFPWYKIAAIWVIPLVILGAAAAFYISANKQSKIFSNVVFQHAFTNYGERSLIILPDSSKVWLNGGSSLVYPSHFVTSERNVCLTGEAFFEVTKDSLHPFIVDVNKMQLKVLGTTFNVFSYPDNPQIVATLESGKLQVNVVNDKKPYILTSDSQLIYDTKAGQVEVRSVKASDYSVWRVPTLYFEETELIYALQQIERTYNVKVHVKNSHYNHQTIRAHFSTDDRIENIMGVIKKLIPSLNYEIIDDEIYIR